MRLFSRSHAVLLALYMTGYGVWYSLLGAGFKTYKLLDYSHFLNPEWLAGDFGGSLIALHSQPPLMSLLIWSIMSLAPDSYEMVFRTSYFAAGFGALLGLWGMLRLLEVQAWWRWLVMAMLTMSPTLYMFATWYGSTHLEFCISAIMLYGLARFLLVRDHRPCVLVLIFSCFALLGLIRPQWHLLLFIGMTLFLLKQLAPELRRKAMLLTFIFLLPIGGWYAKNQLVFGFFGASSWMGANVAQVAHKAAAPDIRAYKDAGKISADFPGDFLMGRILHRVPAHLMPPDAPAALGPYKSNDEGFIAYARDRPRQHYLLYNLNYLGIIASARQDMQDAKILILSHPLGYVATVLRQVLVSSLTPGFLHYSPSLAPVRYYVEQWPQQWLWFALFNMGALVLYLIVPLLALHMHTPAQRDFLYCCMGLMLFMLLTSCALNGYEQERMRWGWQGVYIVFAAIVLQRLCSARHFRRGLQ